MDFEDVGMVVEAAHCMDFANDSRLHGIGLSFDLVDDFDGYNGVVHQRFCLVNLCKATTTEEMGYFILSKDGGAIWQLPQRRGWGGLRRLRRWLHGVGGEKTGLLTVCHGTKLFGIFFRAYICDYVSKML